MDEIQRVGKRDYCLNCGASIQPSDAFCSACGQKVDDNKLGLTNVLSEFFENYISLDSRFGRTLFPFFFQPGLLSQQFIHGRRRNFANPFRLYILSSILFFFCLTSYIERDDKVGEPIIQVELTALNSFENLPEENRKALEIRLDEKTKKTLNQLSDSSFKSAYSFLSDSQQANVIKHFDRDELISLNLLSDTSLVKKNYSSSEKIGATREEVSVENIVLYRDSTHLSEDEVYKRLIHDEDLPYYKRVLFQRLIRISRADDKEVRRYILGNLSLAMFILIPLFALFMKLFYFRRNKYYVAHLIHTMYLQGFAFILFSLILTTLLSFRSIDDYGSTLFLLTFLLFFIYFYFALKRLYEQSYVKTFFKAVNLGLVYFILGLIVLFGEILTSFLLF